MTRRLAYTIANAYFNRNLKNNYFVDSINCFYFFINPGFSNFNFKDTVSILENVESIEYFLKTDANMHP